MRFPWDDHPMTDERRSLIEFPRWDGKLVLAGIFILGYYTLVILMATRPLPATNAGLVRDALLTLGPPIGLIFGALFRTTGAEERSAALRSADLQTAIQTPSVIPVANAVDTLKPLAEQVEDGARTGTRQGVNDALGSGEGANGGPTHVGADTEVIE